MVALVIVFSIVVLGCAGVGAWAALVMRRQLVELTAVNQNIVASCAALRASAERAITTLSGRDSARPPPASVNVSKSSVPPWRRTTVRGVPPVGGE